MNYMTDEKQKRPINSTAVVRLVIWSVVLCILVATFALVMIADSFGGGNTDFGQISLGGYTYQNADTYAVGGGTYDGTVTAIDIDWLNGAIDILPTDDSTVRIEEDYSGSDEDLRLRWKVVNGKLLIKCRAPALITHQQNAPTKHLTLHIPRTMLDALAEVDLDVVRSDVTFSGRTAELDFDGVNGTLTASGHIGELGIDLVDAVLDFTGTLGHADFDGVDFRGTLRLDAARSIDVDGVDHELTLYLAETVQGFLVDRDSLGGDTVIEGFDGVTTPDKGDRLWGDGSFVIDAEGVGCKLTIKKATKD